MTRPLLQKFLTADQSRGLHDDGADTVAGIVVEASNSPALNQPGPLAAAFGGPADTPVVHVVRFQLPPGAVLERPFTDPTPRAWATFPNGFLPVDDLVPAWRLRHTRWPLGAELWEVRTDGQRLLAHHGGAARGWVGAVAWKFPLPWFGTRATWQDQEYFADLTADGNVLLCATTDQAPGPDWTAVRPSAWSRTVPASECQLFEWFLTARFNGLPVRILAQDENRARVQFETDDIEAALAAGARPIDHDVYEAAVERSCLTDLETFTSTFRG